MTGSLLSQNENPGPHRQINITIRLQWNPKAQRMPPQNYAADFCNGAAPVNATARAEQ
jgi:hypothetical protein